MRLQCRYPESTKLTKTLSCEFWATRAYSLVFCTSFGKVVNGSFSQVEGLDSRSTKYGTAWSRSCYKKLWQVGISHQIFIDELGYLTAFADGPNNERLAASHVAGSKDTRGSRH